MEKILLAYGLLKETVTTMIMFYKNMKAMVRLPDGNNNFFDIVTRRYISVVYSYNLHKLHYTNVNRSNKRK